jgi:hypothetical protein
VSAFQHPWRRPPEADVEYEKFSAAKVEAGLFQLDCLAGALPPI